MRLDAAPTASRQTTEIAVIALAPPLGLAGVAVAVWLGAGLSAGNDVDASVGRLISANILMSGALVAVNRLARRAASLLEFRLTQRLLARGYDLRDVFPRFDRPIPQCAGDVLPDVDRKGDIGR